MKADTRHEDVFNDVLCSSFESPSVEHYECVKQETSANAVPNSCLWNPSLKCPAVQHEER